MKIRMHQRGLKNRTPGIDFVVVVSAVIVAVVILIGKPIVLKDKLGI